MDNSIHWPSAPCHIIQIQAYKREELSIILLYADFTSSKVAYCTVFF